MTLLRLESTYSNIASTTVTIVNLVVIVQDKLLGKIVKKLIVSSRLNNRERNYHFITTCPNY